MWQTLSIMTCTLVFGAIGLYMGETIHGAGWQIALTTIAGALGGLGIGFAGADVFRRIQATRTDARPGRDAGDRQ